MKSCVEELLAAAIRADASDPLRIEGREESAEFLRAAADHGVHLLVARSPGSQLPPDLAEACRQTTRAEAAIEALQRLELCHVLKELADGHVMPILLKGTPLAYTYYPRPYLRPRVDTDLLIRRGDLEKTSRVLERLGYRPSDKVTGEVVSSQITFRKETTSGVRHLLDVHWKIANPQVFADVVSYDEMYQEAVAIPALGAHARTPGPVHALLLACLHRVAHHDDDLRLIWIYDIHLVAKRMSADEWRRFEQAAADRRVHAVCAKGISLARHYFHTALPHAMSPELDSRGGHDAHNAEAATAAFLDGRSRRIDILRSDLRALSRWGDRVRLLREHAFPSAAYMRSKYAASHRAWLPLLYGRRIVAGGWQWLRRVK